MRKECENLLVEFEAFAEGEPMSASFQGRFKTHMAECPECMDAVLALCDIQQLDESLAIPSSWESDKVWNAISKKLGIRTASERIPVFRRSRRWIGIAAVIAFAAVLSLYWLPKPPTGSLVGQTWSRGGITRSAPDPDIFAGSEPVELSIVIGGNASDRWLLAVVLMKDGELAMVRLGENETASIKVDGEYEATVLPFVVHPGNLPTELILLFTEQRVTAEDWIREGPNAVPTGLEPTEVARDLAKRFNGRTVLLPLGSSQ